MNGPALAGGLDLATLCDIKICVPGASFGHPEIKFDAPPLNIPLRWIVGCGLARDLCLTGRVIDAGEALRIGLVSEVVTGEDLMERAVSLAKTVLEAPLPTLKTAKSYMVENSGKGFEESFVAEHDIPFEGFVNPSNPQRRTRYRPLSFSDDSPAPGGRYPIDAQRGDLSTLRHPPRTYPRHRSRTDPIEKASTPMESENRATVSRNRKNEPTCL